MTSAEATAENEALSDGVLGIIDAYRMGAVLDAENLCVKKTAPETAPREPAFGAAAETSGQQRRTMR